MSEPGVSLLHNMSVPSKTTIVYKGPTDGETKQIIFCLPSSIGICTPAAILSLLAGEKRDSTNTAQELRSLLNQQALLLPFPAVVLVQTEHVDPLATVETDLLNICTVLSKTSDRVYLRDKEPNLTNIRPGRRIALLIAEGIR